MALNTFFRDLKEGINMRRMPVASGEKLAGTVHSARSPDPAAQIQKQMEDHGLYKNYSMQSLLYELDFIECY